MSSTSFRDPDFGTVTVRKNPRARRLILRVNKQREVVLTIPRGATLDDGLRFLSSRRDWVFKALERVKPVEPVPEEEIASLRSAAKAYLPGRLSELAALHGFSYTRVFLKHNTSNWGSCSSKGNINLNISLMRVPAYLRDYVLLHELCHLKYLNHGPEFHALLESLCPGHRALARELRSYSPSL